MQKTDKLTKIILFVAIAISSFAHAEEVWDSLYTNIKDFDYCEPWVLRTFAGVPQAGYAADQIDGGDGGLAVNAKIRPSGTTSLAVTPDGTVYFTSRNNHVVRKITPDGIVSRAVGQYGVQADYTIPGSFGDGGPALNATLDSPMCVACDNKGNLFIRDNARVRKVAKDGTISTYAGTTLPPALTFTNQDLVTAMSDLRFSGPATQARLIRPDLMLSCRMTVSADGTLFLMEPIGIRKITPDGMISPMVEGGRWSWWPGSDIGEFSFSCIATNSKNELYATGGQHFGFNMQPNILKIDRDGTVTKVLGATLPNPASGFQSPVGPVTPEKPIHTYTLGFDANDRLWWSGGIDTTHFAHWDSDNVIRWSGMLQTHYAAQTVVENGPAPYDIRTSPPDSFVFLPNGSIVTERYRMNPDFTSYVTLSILSPGVPQNKPQLSVSPAAVNVTAKIGDPQIAVPIDVHNGGTLSGWYACKKDVSDVWLHTYEVNFSPPGGGTDPAGILPGQTLTQSLYIDPSKIFVPGTYHTKVHLYTLATTDAPSEIDITLNLQPADYGSPNLAPVITDGDNRGAIRPIDEDTQLLIPVAAQDDGKPANPGTLTFSIATQPKHGTAVIQNGVLIYTPNPNFNTQSLGGVDGYESFTWKVSDGELEASATVNIYINSVNDAPTANAGPDQSITLPNAATLAGSGADVDGKYSDAYKMWIPDTIEFRWSVVSGPGVVTFGNETDPKSSAAFSQSGTYVLQLTVSDGRLSESDNVTITVAPGTGPNTAPVAYDVFASTGDDDPIDIAFHIIDDGLNSAPVFIIVSGPQHGTVTLNGGVAHYVPSANYSGPDSFTYKANDGEFDSNVATVSISVIPYNDPPTVNAGPDLIVQLGNPALLYGSASDPENDPLTITWSMVSGPASVTFANASSATTSATLPAAGVYILKLTVSDGAWKVSDTVQVTVQVGPPVNQAPVVNAGADKNVTLPDQATLSGTVSDDGLPNPPALTIAWSKISGPGDVTFADGTVASTTATFSVAGTYVLRLTASDSDLSSSDDISIIVKNASPPPNHAPVIGSISADPSAVNVGQPVTFSISATDADNDPLTYLWHFGDGTDGLGSSATHIYSGAGTFTAICTVSDKNGGFQVGTVSVIVNAIHGGGDPSTDPSKPFTITKLAASVKFGASAKDSCMLSGSIPEIANPFSPANIEVMLDVGGMVRAFTLDARGRAKNSDGSFALKLKPARHAKGVFVGGTIPFQAKIVHSTLSAAWADEGLDPNVPQKNAPFSLNVNLTFNNIEYTSSVDARVTSDSKGAKIKK